MNPLDVLTVSKVERYDPEQVGGCPRRFHFEDVEGHRPEQSSGQEEGDIAHDLTGRYLSAGSVPGRVRMGKIVRAAIAKGELPAPGPDLMVESRFDGQPRRGPDGRWLRVNVERTLHFAGAPWDGFIDLRFRRSDVPEAWDHKFSSRIREVAKRPEQLIRTVQMPVYALDCFRLWPDARAIRLVHHNVSRVGELSFLSPIVVTRDQVLERAAEIAALVDRMRATVAGARSQEDVPFNRRACNAWRGCPHQFRCSAYRRNAPMNLTDEELAMFGEPAPAAAPSPGPVSDTMNQPDADDAIEADGPVAPAPKASVPAPQPAPVCGDCGTTLTAENTSTLRSGERKHVGCPAAAPAAPTATATTAEAPAEAPKRRGRPPGSGKGKVAAAMAAALQEPTPAAEADPDQARTAAGLKETDLPPAPDVAAGQDTSTGDDARFARESPPPPCVETTVSDTPCQCGSTEVGKASGACAGCGRPARSRVAVAPVGVAMVSTDGKSWEPVERAAARHGLGAGPEKPGVRSLLERVAEDLVAVVARAAEAGNLACAREALGCLETIHGLQTRAHAGKLT